MNRSLIPVENSLYHHSPKSLSYDTLSGTFFYENSILSYLEGDVFLKNGGFIKDEKINEGSYKHGYYVSEASTYVQYLKQRGLIV